MKSKKIGTVVPEDFSCPKCNSRNLWVTLPVPMPLDDLGELNSEAVARRLRGQTLRSNLSMTCRRCEYHGPVSDFAVGETEDPPAWRARWKFGDDGLSLHHDSGVQLLMHWNDHHGHWIAKLPAGSYVNEVFDSPELYELRLHEANTLWQERYGACFIPDLEYRLVVPQNGPWPVVGCNLHLNTLCFSRDFVERVAACSSVPASKVEGRMLTEIMLSIYNNRVRAESFHDPVCELFLEHTRQARPACGLH